MSQSKLIIYMIVRSGEQSALIILMQRRIHPKFFIGDVEKNIHFNYTGIS